MSGERTNAAKSAKTLPPPARSASRPPTQSAVIGNQAMQQLMHAGLVRPKLVVGSADDPAEAEADRIAAHITQPHAPPCACGGTCSTCRDGNPVLRRQAQRGTPATTWSSNAILGGPGRPMEMGLRAYFEPRLGTQLDKVRLHDDPKSQSTARAIAARAFTVGNDIGFATGQFAPHTHDGRTLLAHELAHIVQGEIDPPIRRESPDDPSPATVSPVPEPPAESTQPAPTAQPPVPQGPVVRTVDGIDIVADEDYMLYQLRQLVARQGTAAPHRFYAGLANTLPADRAFKRDYDANPSDVSGGVPRTGEQLDAESLALNVIQKVVNLLDQEETRFRADFEKNAKATARQTLDKNEQEERAEAFRYGIDWKTVSVPVADCLAGDCKHDVTEFSMAGESPAVTGLQNAAKILLARRQDLERAKHDMTIAQIAMSADEYSNENAADQVAEAEQTFRAKSDAYDLTLGFLSQNYPILAAVGDRDKSVESLEALTNQKAGPETAALLGQEIVRRLGNIAKVRDGLDNSGSVNIWRLPTLTEVTSRQMGADQDPFQKRLVDEGIEANSEPALLEQIALLVFNIGAMLLAGPTGGASLAVAAGVNAAVAVEHIHDYVIQSALAGTAFDKARALSQDEPSLFWLAVEVVGVGVDAVVAFKTVAEAVHAVEAAKVAGDAAMTASKMTELEAAATRVGGKELAAKVAAHFGEHPAADTEVLKALGLSGEEIKSLGTATEFAEADLAGGTASGKLATGAKVSRSGHIFSCASPCTWMREKYAALLGPETKEGESALLKQYLAYEKRATEVAEEVQLAKGPEELARAQSKAAALEQELANFDTALKNEMRARLIDTAMKGLGQKYKILQDAGLDAVAIERVLAKSGNLGHMKGQLLEELLASRVRKMLGTEAGRAALAGDKAAAPIEFIDGFRITDADGAQLSDGMILVPEGSRYRVVTLFESKAGVASSRGLRYAYKSIKDMSADELQVLRSEAIEELREQSATMAKMAAADINSKYPKQVDKMMRALTKGESGQIRKDIERLTDGTILVDGKPRRIIPRSTSIKKFGALPSDVSGVAAEERIAADKIANFQAMNLDIASSDLEGLAKALAAELAAPPAAVAP